MQKTAAKGLQILYLHGLGSNGKGSTVQALQALGVNVTAPDYQPQHYEASMRLLEQYLGDNREGGSTPDIVIGTSMGGYYAFKAAEHYGIKSLAVNPCIDPSEMLSKYLDSPATDYITGNPINFDQEMLAAFEAISVNRIKAQQAPLEVVIGCNDDVIDPEQMRDYCRTHNIYTTETDWGHRVGDTEQLLSIATKMVESIALLEQE